jgi:hypothetical protein
MNEGIWGMAKNSQKNGFKYSSLRFSDNLPIYNKVFSLLLFTEILIRLSQMFHLWVKSSQAVRQN